VTDPAPPPAAPKVSGRLIALGIVLGLVLVPLAVVGVMQIVNLIFFECSGGGGAEDSLACTLRAVVPAALSIPFGAPIGFFVAYGIGKRMLKAQAAKTIHAG
jgi:hypothetical protein